MTESPFPTSPSSDRRPGDGLRPVPATGWVYRLLGLGLTSVTFAGCGSIPVDVAVPDPIVIDVNMNVDVKTTSDQRQNQRQNDEVNAALERRKRMAEVQGLKNDRIIGEDREGYLQIVRPPANAQYDEYAKKIVEGENNDRAVIYLAAAQKEGKPMELIQTEYARLWRDRAFPGEWVEQDNGTWVQK